MFYTYDVKLSQNGHIFSFITENECYRNNLQKPAKVHIIQGYHVPNVGGRILLVRL